MRGDIVERSVHGIIILFAKRGAERRAVRQQNLQSLFSLLQDPNLDFALDAA
jgi:hypothetical protein